MSFNFTQLKSDLTATQDWLRKEYAQISTGRAHPALLDSITIDAYGSQQPLKNLASISVEDARTLRIVPFDSSQVNAMQKAVSESGLPFALAVDGKGLRANIPQLTEENKRSLIKLLKDKLEEARVRVRAFRQKVDKDIDSAEKEGELSADEKKRNKEEMQKHIDATNIQLDTIFSEKETDIMRV